MKMGNDRVKSFCDVIQYILKKFSIDTVVPEDCDTYKEAMERMLEPAFILYQEIDAQDLFPEHNHEYVIAFEADGTPCAILPSILGSVVVSCDGKKHRLSRKKQHFTGNAFILSRPFPKGDGGFLDFLHLTALLLRPEEYLVLIGAPIAVTLLGLFLPRITNVIVNELLPAGIGMESGIFIFEFILFLTVGILRAAITLVKNCFMILVKKHVSVQAESAMIARMLLLSEQYLGTLSTGGVPLRLSATCEIIESVLNVFFDALVTLVFSLSYIPQMFSYSPVLVFVALPFLILQVVSVFLRTRLRRENIIQLNRAKVNQNEFLYDTLNGMQKIHAYHTQEHMFGVWQEKYECTLDYKHNPPLLLKMETILPVFLTSACTAVLVAILKPAGVSPGTYLAFSSSYGLLSAALMQLNSLLYTLLLIPSQLDLVRPVFKATPENTEKSRYVKHIDGNVCFQNICFSYGENQPLVLRNVSFSAKKGEKIAIVGPSGCGKSTFLKLLIGFLEPCSGAVLYDERNLSELNRKSLRNHMGIILQTSRLMPGTFATNLRYAKTDATEEQLWEAIDRAALRSMVEVSEQKLERVVPDIKNYGLSGGQQQLLLLARSYVQNPNVMILDEAFSALDAETTKTVLDGLFSCDATVFMVSHRISAVRDFDRIFVIDKGTIAQEGSFSELMRQDGIFARMAMAQNVTENDPEA